MPSTFARHGGGNREFDRDIDAAEVLRGDAFEVGVVELVQLQRDVEAVLGRELLDQPAHLAVADDGAAQACTASLRSNTSGSSSAKNSSCSAVDGAHQVGLRHHEAEVQQRCALRDHADIDAVERVEDAARHARSVADVLADQADDRLIVLHRRLRRTAAARRRIASMLRGVVDGERDADLARSRPCRRRLVAVEDFEDAAQEAVRHQHARGVDVDQRDLALAGDRLDDVVAVHGFGGDARARPPRAGASSGSAPGCSSRWPAPRSPDAAPWRRNMPARRPRRTRWSSRDGRRGGSSGRR